jgi:hypothetical protein
VGGSFNLASRAGALARRINGLRPSLTDDRRGRLERGYVDV